MLALRAEAEGLTSPFGGVSVVMEVLDRSLLKEDFRDCLLFSRMVRTSGGIWKKAARPETETNERTKKGQRNKVEREDRRTEETYPW